LWKEISHGQTSFLPRGLAFLERCLLGYDWHDGRVIPRSQIKALAQQLMTMLIISLAMGLVLLLEPGNQWGIQPRTSWGLLGILLAPWQHENRAHFWHNLPPFLMLGWLVMLESIARFWRVTLLITLLSGLTVWLLGQSHANYLGSSALVFGYLGYVLMRAWVSRRTHWIIAGVVALILFGGLMQLFLKWNATVSWLGHVSGFIAGMIAASRLHRPRSFLDG